MTTKELTIKTPVQKKVRKRKVRTIWKVIALALSLLCIFSVIDANVERISDLASKQLMLGVEDGEEWAIEKFNNYIERDIYLYDGPITIKAMADKYELDYDTLVYDYQKSNYVSLQKYFDDVIEPNIK